MSKKTINVLYEDKNIVIGGGEIFHKMYGCRNLIVPMNIWDQFENNINGKGNALRIATSEAILREVELGKIIL